MQAGKSDEYSTGASRRLRERHSQNQESDVGNVSGESTVFRDESDTIANEDCSRRDPERDCDYQIKSGGEVDIGGMLSQLRKLQESHLAYVKAHEERLKLRLEDNHKHQKEVMEAMAALEQKIFSILQSHDL